MSPPTLDVRPGPRRRARGARAGSWPTPSVALPTRTGAVTLGKRYAALGADRRGTPAPGSAPRTTSQAARELARRGRLAFAEEIPALRGHPGRRRGPQLRRLLVPRDPLDDKDVILEIKAGEGGDESALFAADLLRMYLRYAERRGWATEILDSGGVRSRWVQGRPGGGEGPGCRRPDEAPFARFKFEGGVHRVQRVPVTESGGGSIPRGRRPRASRGRGRRRRPSTPPTCASTCIARRTRRPERQHHRLSRANHPSAERRRGLLPEREEPAAEQGVRYADPSLPASGRSRSRPRTPTGIRRSPGPRCAPSIAASGSAPTTSPRAGSRSSGRVQGPQFGRGARRGPRRRSSSRCVDADRKAARLASRSPTA